MIISHRTALRASLPLLFVTVATSPCFGFAEFARSLLLLQTTGSATYDSYFIGTETNEPDTIYTVYPSLRYRRNAGRGAINADAGMAFNRYDVNKDLDSDDIRANLSIELPTVEGERLDGNFNVGYNEATVVDLYVNDRVTSQTVSSNLLLNYRLGERIDLGETFSYSSATRDIYSDQDIFQNQFVVNYNGFLRGTSLDFTHNLTIVQTSGDAFTGVGLDQYSNSLSIGLTRALYGDVKGSLNYGYTVLNRSSGETTNGETRSASSFITATLDGPFLPRNRFPRLTSSASFSYSQSAMAGLNDNASKFLSGRLSLSWAARERTKLHVNASRSLDLSVTNVAVENTRVGAGFDEQIGRGTSLGGTVGYTWSSYRGVTRTDSVLDASLTISRTFNKYLSASAGYTYQYNQNSSTGFQPGRYLPTSYERHTVMGSVTVTF
ncbi:MAG: outer membrane beta-barrel protein [Nibricoccus sp.]